MNHSALYCPASFGDPFLLFHLTAVTFLMSEFSFGNLGFLVGLANSEGVVFLLLQPCTFWD